MQGEGWEPHLSDVESMLYNRCGEQTGTRDRVAQKSRSSGSVIVGGLSLPGGFLNPPTWNMHDHVRIRPRRRYLDTVRSLAADTSQRSFTISLSNSNAICIVMNALPTILVLTCTWAVCFTGLAVYRVVWHPLAKIRGPKVRILAAP